MRVFDSRRSGTVGVLLLLLLTLAVYGAPSKEGAAVRNLSFKNDSGGLEVKITTTEHAQFTYFELKDPHRLVVDFPGIQNSIGFKEKPIAIAGVERVRTSNFTDK